jgi:hypothetical protein
MANGKWQSTALARGRKRHEKGANFDVEWWVFDVE